MATVDLEDFDLEDFLKIEPQFFEDYSFRKPLGKTETIGKYHCRMYTQGDTYLAEILPDGIHVQRRIYSKDFEDQEPHKVEIWMLDGEYEFKREYHHESSVDFDQVGRQICSRDIL